MDQVEVSREKVKTKLRERKKKKGQAPSSFDLHDLSMIWQFIILGVVK